MEANFPSGDGSDDLQAKGDGDGARFDLQEREKMKGTKGRKERKEKVRGRGEGGAMSDGRGLPAGAGTNRAGEVGLDLAVGDDLICSWIRPMKRLLGSSSNLQQVVHAVGALVKIMGAAWSSYNERISLKHIKVLHLK